MALRDTTCAPSESRGRRGSASRPRSSESALTGGGFRARPAAPLPKGTLGPRYEEPGLHSIDANSSLALAFAEGRPGSRRLWLTPQLDRSRGELGDQAPWAMQNSILGEAVLCGPSRVVPLRQRRPVCHCRRPRPVSRGPRYGSPLARLLDGPEPTRAD